MGTRPPDRQRLAEISRRYAFDLTEADLASFQSVIGDAIASYDRVEQLYIENRPAPPDRDHGPVPPEENPLGAWYVRTDIFDAGAGEGPLAGHTVAIKDNVAVAGVPMSNGSRSLDGYVPLRDATVVTRLLGAGATIAGKAVCEDLCFSGGSHSSATGPVHNPWDPARTTGGSSSGSAALVTAGDVDLAIGGDQGGSIRMPSAFCGIVGHKPTHGLVPYTGAFPIESTIDHLGPLTRTVTDAALMLRVLAGPDGLDPRQPSGEPDTAPHDYVGALDDDAAGLRVGILAEGFGIPGLSDPRVDEAVRATAATLTEAGQLVDDVAVPWHRDALHVWNTIATEGATAQMIDGNGYGLNWPGLYDPELVAHYGSRRFQVADDLSESVKFVALHGRYTLDEYHGRHYAMARNLVPVLRAAYDAALAAFDVLVLPTVPFTATVIHDPGGTREDYLARAFEPIANAAPFNVTGHPATSVPAGSVDGMPVGMMIVGRHLDDATCLRVARTVERLAGGFPVPGSR